MLGHELTVHETNARGAVAICGCGWYGIVHSARRYQKPGTKTVLVQRDHAAEAAENEWRGHLRDVRLDIVARSDRELTRIGALSRKANAELQHRGRYGHP